MIVAPNEALERAVLAASPLLAVPRAASLPSLAPWQHRYLASKWGLMFEGATPHFQIVAPYLPVVPGVHPLPYGELEPEFAFIGGGLPGALFDKLCRLALGCGRTEGAWLVMDELSTGLRLVEPPVLSAGGAHISYSMAEIAPDKLVVDAHSHGRHGAFFSATDNLSEDGAYVALVFGKTCEASMLEVAARVCFYGRTFPLALSIRGGKLAFSPSGPCGAEGQAYGVNQLLDGARP